MERWDLVKRAFKPLKYTLGESLLFVVLFALVQTCSSALASSLNLCASYPLVVQACGVALSFFSAMGLIAVIKWGHRRCIKG